MAFNPFGFVLGSMQAEREGITDPQARTRLGLLGGLFGSPVTGLVLTTVLARREAEVQAPTGVEPTSELVEVPKITGKRIPEAQQALESLGLRNLPRDAHSNTTGKGIIISQDPEAGTAIRA